MKRAYLALQNGAFFKGRSFGAEGETSGEVVFNTAMTGYQEVLTDPSYKGQIVLMTYPEIGNYGINRDDVESRRPWVEGFIVREYCGFPSNFRSRESLGNYLNENGVVGIWDIDTRMITRMIREQGTMAGFISTECDSREILVERARGVEGIEGRDLVKHVTSVNDYEWSVGEFHVSGGGYVKGEEYRGRYERIPHIGVLDCGVKLNILRMLVTHGFRVSVYPAATSFAALEGKNLDALFISNGPGDPEGVPHVVDTVRKALGVMPVFGICLGHQILGLALGGKTFKLKFGHHGMNQPTLDLSTGKVEITSQNHNFSVDERSIKEKAKITHINLNDNTVEGLEIPDLRAFSVQYHPEASPGPHDSRYIFHRFYEYLEKGWA